MHPPAGHVRNSPFRDYRPVLKRMPPVACPSPSPAQPLQRSAKMCFIPPPSSPACILTRFFGHRLQCVREYGKELVLAGHAMAGGEPTGIVISDKGLSGFVL